MRLTLLLLTALLATTLVATRALSETVYLELSPADRMRADAIMRDQAEKDAKAIAELQALRDKLLRTPPLAPERNPLLGQWKVEARARKADALADAFDSLVNIEKAKCEMLFGADSVTEFRARDWASIDSYGNDTLGSIQYRGNARHVWMIPEKSIGTGMMFYSFEFVNANRVNVLTPTVNGDCALNRVGGPKLAVAGATAKPAGPSPNAAAAIAPPPSKPTRPPEEICSRTFLDKLGVATFSPVRQTVDLRYKETMQVDAPEVDTHTRIAAGGSACDDPRIVATLYDFDANGVLQRITYQWARPAGPAPSPIFNERVKTLSIFHTLPPPEKPGRLRAETSLGRLTLQEQPEKNALLEIYSARK